MASELPDFPGSAGCCPGWLCAGFACAPGWLLCACAELPAAQPARRNAARMELLLPLISPLLMSRHGLLAGETLIIPRGTAGAFLQGFAYGRSAFFWLLNVPKPLVAASFARCGAPSTASAA